MKVFTKVCLVICAFLAVLGIVFCVVSASMGFGYRQFWEMAREGAFQIGSEDFGFWDDDFWSAGISLGDGKAEAAGTEGDWVQSEESWQAADIRNLDIDFDFGRLEILHTDSDKIEMEVQYRNTWEKYQRSIYWMQDGDTLMVEDSVDKKIFRLFRHGVGDAKLVIRIPKDKMFDELTLEIGAADVDVSLDTQLFASEMDISLGTGQLQGSSAQDGQVILNARELNLDIGAGKLELSGIIADEMDAECGAGEMSLKNVSARSANVECGVGRVVLEMDGRKEYYNYDVECGIGHVVIGDSTYSGLGTSKNIDNGGDRNMNIECGIGEVEISFTEE